MNSSTFTVTPVNGDRPVRFDIEHIYTQFLQLEDTRKRRGVRYPLAVLLTIAVLAKLAGASQLRALAEWARLRRHDLAPLFALPRASMPHPTTWSRILGQHSLAEQVEALVQQLLAPAPTA
jgi:hypothetical protein